MARREVIEVICDRCGRTETQGKSEETKAESYELLIEFQGEKHKYGDLCMRCRGACEGYFKSMTKQVEKKDEAPPAPKKPGILSLGRKTG